MGFRSPATPGLTSLLRINRQGQRRVAGSNTSDEGQAHDQRRAFPLWGGATIQGSRGKYQPLSDHGFSDPPYHINRSAVLLKDISRIRRQRTV